MLRRLTGFASLAVLIASPLAAETIHGCVDQKGTLRIVAAAGACDSKEYAIQLASDDPDQPVIVGSLRFGNGPLANIFGFAGGGVTMLADAIGGGGGGAGAADFGRITVVREVDSASPDLFLSVAMGQHHPGATITFAGGGRVSLYDVILTSWALAGAAGTGGGPHLEELEIDYAKIEIELAGETACYDRKRAVKC